MSGPSAARRVVELAPGSIRAVVNPTSYLPATRTIEVTWTTGERVPRYDFFRDLSYLEELSLDADAVDLRRLNNHASVLQSHEAYGLAGVLGVVERAWLTDESGAREGRALLRLADTPDVAAIVRKIEDGIIRNVSVGYRTHTAEEIERGGRDTPAVIQATRWEPLEISFVAVGADSGAHVRGTPPPTQRRYPCTITLRKEGRTMPTAEEIKAAQEAADAGRAARGHQTRQGKPPEPDEEKKPDDDADNGDGDEDRSDDPQQRARTGAPGSAGDAESAALSERTRAREITEVVALAGLGHEFERELIDAGVGLDVARARVFEKLRAAQPTIRAGTSARVGQDRLAAFRNGVQNALLHRAHAAELTPDGRDFVGLSCMELAREWVRTHGGSTRGWSKERVAQHVLKPRDFDALLDVANFQARGGGQAYLVTDDFVSVLLNLARASLTQGYTVAPRTFTSWTRQVSLPDFRQMNRISMGLAPKLAVVPQHAEYTRGALPSKAEIIQLQTWGKIIAFTRQAMINDDLGALTRIPQLFGNSAATMESDVVYGVLTGNPNMSDGQPLFSAAHNNVGTAAAITVASMAEARRLLRVQTSPDGQYLNLTPMFLLCGPVMEVEALQLTAATVVPTTLGTAIPIALKSVEVVVDARIQGTNWYIIASPSMIDTIEYAYLEGAAAGGPTLEARDGFDVDGVEFKAREDFGSAPIEWRGMVWNAGA